MTICLFLLPNPFRLQHLPSLPLDAHDLARDLNLSLRTAQRICEGKRLLKDSELVYLQVLHFGLIPDAIFLRHGWHFKNGMLLSHKHDLDIDVSDASAYCLLRNNHYLLLGELERAKQRIKELEQLLHPPKPCKILFF